MSKSDDHTSPVTKIAYATVKTYVNGPVTWLHDNVVMPLRPKETPVYYHRRFRRVPTVDECDVYDEVCKFEANEQFMRDREVDNEILRILKNRAGECRVYHEADSNRLCKDIIEEYEKAKVNWFTKYGDIGVSGGAVEAFMKQKHRMIYERRHGTYLRE